MKITYEHGGEGYDDLYDKWVSEGRAATFEILGYLGDEIIGGQTWYALGWRSETYPQFLLQNADGPTVLDTSDDLDKTGRITKKGYMFTRPKDGGLNIKFWPTSGWRIRTRAVHKEYD